VALGVFGIVDRGGSIGCRKKESIPEPSFYELVVDAFLVAFIDRRRWSVDDAIDIVHYFVHTGRRCDIHFDASE
jgi:hypothetical protein